MAKNLKSALGFKSRKSLLKNPASAFRRKKPPTILGLEFPLRSLRKLKAGYADLYISLSIAHNEFSALTKLHVISTFSEQPDSLQHLYAESQRLVILKLLAGKMYEIWEVVRARYFGSAISKDMDPRLPERAAASLLYLKKYFNRKDNLICLMRNEFAFHYTRADLSYTLRYLKARKYRSVYYDVSHGWNDLYLLGEYSFLCHFLKRLGVDGKESANRMYLELGEVGEELQCFIRAVLDLITDEIIESAGSGTIANLITVTHRPSLSNAFIPALVDLGGHSVELDQRFLRVEADSVPVSRNTRKTKAQIRAAKRR